MGDDLDPFGRKKDENPLASLGWQGGETASTAAEPTAGREREAEPALFGTATTTTETAARTPPTRPSPTPIPPAGARRRDTTTPGPRRPRRAEPSRGSSRRSS